MASTAAHLHDHVLPDEARRQWVFTFPQPLPRLLAWEPDLLRRVLAVVARSVQDCLRRRTRQPDGRAGIITFVQSFTGDLRLFVHFHVVAPEGVWVTGADELQRFVPKAILQAGLTSTFARTWTNEEYHYIRCDGICAPPRPFLVVSDC